MKKFAITLILTALCAGVPVFAQTISEKNQSEYYYVNVLVEKVFTAPQGYLIQYRKTIPPGGPQ